MLLTTFIHAYSQYTTTTNRTVQMPSQRNLTVVNNAENITWLQVHRRISLPPATVTIISNRLFSNKMDAQHHFHHHKYLQLLFQELMDVNKCICSLQLETSFSRSINSLQQIMYRYYKSSLVNVCQQLPVTLRTAWFLKSRE